MSEKKITAAFLLPVDLAHFTQFELKLNKMASKESSDSDVTFLKEEFKVVCTGPFPVSKTMAKISVNAKKTRLNLLTLLPQVLKVIQYILL